MPFTIKNILTEDEIVKKKIRDTGAYDWTRKENLGRGLLFEVAQGGKRLLLKGSDDKRRLLKSCRKDHCTLKYVDLTTIEESDPTLSKKEQAVELVWKRCE